MEGIEQGTTRGLADTDGFVRMVGRLLAGESRPAGGLFEGGGPVYVTRAPGRLDLMGGIADYSGSLVLELPIASATHAALQPRAEGRIVVVSLPPTDAGRERMFEMPLEDLYDAAGRPLEYADAARYFKRGGHGWAAYVAGVFHVLARERGQRFERGARILIRSEVPEGKGVSSSAALEVATMQAVAAAYEIELDPRELAFLCQKVENLVACAPCGVMDQMTSVCGEAGKLLALLCQPGELKGSVALPEELEVWGVDSGIRHSVGGADYGTVRTAAFMGYRMIAELAGLRVSEGGGRGHVRIEDPRWGGYLANITPAEFEGRYASHLPARMSGAEFLERYQGITDAVTAVDPARHYHVRQATQHPVNEHARVTRFAEILEGPGAAGRAAELGELMYKSHKSYSACCLGSPGTDELVRLVREAGADSGLYGAKITGGGSGGTVAVLGRKGARAGVEAVAREYERRTGHAPLVISGSSPGAAAFGHMLISDE
ncbi:MAG TPA: galactokinase family protein [Pyrinomonadaceae bacterium]|jgi:L-arabinokinase